MPHHIYRRNFIKSVIFRLDFPIPIPSLAASQRPIEFQRAVFESFPIFDETRGFNQEVLFTPQGVATNRQENIVYNFKNSDRTCQIGLSSSFLFVEHSRYNGYDNFSNLIDLSVNNLFNQWPETQINRFGLRYQNSIDIPNPDHVLDWSPYFSPNLLSAQSLFGDANNLTRFIVHSEVRTADYFGRIVAGMPNPDYPGLIRQRQFVLDIDLYTSEAVSRQDIETKRDLYHEAIINYFETSIAQPLRDYMDAENNV